MRNVGSNPNSRTTGTTPIASNQEAFSGFRVVPATSRRASHKSNASRGPITPVAPARKILIALLSA
jgi:hypothetical protein